MDRPKIQCQLQILLQGAWKSAQRTQKVANILEFPLIDIQNGYADLMKSSGLEKTANGPSQPIG